MNQYLIRYRPPRDNFATNITEKEKVIVENHFTYLQKLHQEKKLLLAGRTEDAELGIAVVNAADEKEAEEILVNDPAVRDGVFLGSVKLFRVALKN